MNEVIILDTGPLVAWLSDKDAWHAWAAAQFGLLSPPLVTCEAVLTEACFLYAREGGEPARIPGKVRTGILQVPFEIASEAAEIETLLSCYADTSMSLADACMVRLSERHKVCRVLTLDRHFNHYRRYGRSVIPLLSPW